MALLNGTPKLPEPVDIYFHAGLALVAAGCYALWSAGVMLLVVGAVLMLVVVVGMVRRPGA